MTFRIATAALLALALGPAAGCDGGAAALRSADGGPPCTWEAPAWRVTASGAVTYDSRVAIAPTAFNGDVVRVDEATGSFAVAYGEGQVEIVMSPVPPTGLAALQVGATVTVRLDHGIVVEEWGNLVLALTEGTGTATEGPSLDVETVFGAVRFESAGALCTTPTPAGAGCTSGLTQTFGVASWFDGSTTMVPGETTTVRMWPYDFQLIASERPASEVELAAVTPQGARLCSIDGTPRIVVGTTARASAGASPRCATVVSPQAPVLAGPLGWRVQASGAFAYDTLTHTSDWDHDRVEQSGTISSTNVAEGAFTLATPVGSTEIAVTPIRPEWLDALSIGRTVVATFENGVILRDAVTDEVLLAVVASAANPASLDVGPLHLARGDNDCVQVRPATSPCSPGSVVTRTRFVATITLGSTSATARVGDAPTSLSDGVHTYEVMLASSVSQSGGPANPMLACDVGIREALYVAIGRPAP